ncbi:MAG TPA: AMED_5909 family protein [Pseudonocardiaceae bacterium]
MTVTKTTNPRAPQTLMQAHAELVRIRPGRDASSTAWLAYYQRSVSVYEQIAETDPGHEGEARYWAQRERARAQNIAARIRALRSGE